MHALHYLDVHRELESKLQVLDTLGLIHNVTRTNVKPYRFDEALVDYLTATTPRSSSS